MAAQDERRNGSGWGDVVAAGDRTLQPWLGAPWTPKSLGASGSNDICAGNAKFLPKMCKLLILASLLKS